MGVDQRNRHIAATGNFIIYAAGILIMIPLAPFLCRYIPPVMVGGFNIDMVIAIVVAVLVVRLMIWLTRPLIIPALLVVTALLGFNELSGQHSHYRFSTIADGYQSLVMQNWVGREQKQTDQLSFNPGMFENAGERVSRRVSGKVQYKDSVVRNFAVQHSLEHFDEYHFKYRELARYFSLFRYINRNFKYVNDAQRDEYYATPRETILNGMGGDCDDHSILMAGSLMSIGAKCRLVIIKGHMYPELYIGDKKQFDIAQQAIIQLFGNDGVDRIYYHENQGEYWLNLDYTAIHPGGPYMNDEVLLLINIP